jgi:hypothetical protein
VLLKRLQKKLGLANAPSGDLIGETQAELSLPER